MLRREARMLLNSQKGMSLIEILIAITLLGVVGTLVVGNVMDSLREGEVEATKIQLKNFEKILMDYKRKCNLYPTTDQGLDALVSAPTAGRECKKYPKNGFVKAIPQDPWGYEYLYESDGRNYKIMSLGVDGMEGGEDADADITLEGR